MYLSDLTTVTLAACGGDVCAVHNIEVSLLAALLTYSPVC